MTARFKDLCIDATDHQALADWWCTAIGYVRRDAPAGDEGENTVPIHDPGGEGPLIWVNHVTEAKTVKNRMHLDVWGSVAELLALGATLVRAQEADIEWSVMADPEGNEFCVFTPVS
ncbi:bleomycin resistance protein [Streptomyces sp. 150FB]|uniref:VOC family protein n=1 Tax=Streptomyces sp. 150FB TaxID=1576605 RepID=UPI00058950C5|nr:VOC family protein [Streptomyces sp. 150FB]KIF77842.1 bleomycin resistance protein [Streptomyces sp. 150FB]